MKMSILSRFTKNEDGNFAAIFAIAMIPMVAAVAGTVEFSEISRNKAALQDSLDSALINIALDAASNPNETQLEKKGQEFFESNVRGSVGVDAVLDYLGVETKSDSSTVFKAKITKQFKGSVSSLFNGPLTVNATVMRQSGPSACMLALNKTVAAAVDLNGTTDVTLESCIIASNSNSNSSITRSGSATLNAECVQTRGRTVGIKSDPRTTLDCSQVKESSYNTADPFASFVPPVGGTCTHLNIPGGNGNNWKDIYPGTYCNNSVTINGGRKVRFNSGTYIFKGTDINFLGGAEVVGDGVTIYLYDGADLKIASNAIVSLTAPISGTDAGILIYSPTSNPANLSFQGGSGQKLTGFIYNPAGQIDFQGNSGTSSDQCIRLIGDTLKLSGTSKMKQDCTAELGGRDISTTKTVRIVQ